MTGLFLLLFLDTINLAQLDCSFSESGCNCKDIELNTLLDEFYRNLPVDASSFQFSSLVIRQSTVGTIDYLPALPAILQELKIEDSFVDNVEQNAFEEYQDLIELSLSNNNLTNISFVISLPQNLKRLDLSKNNISHIKDVFQKFTYLQYLDFSHNRIDTLDLTTIYQISSVSFNENRITNIIPNNHDYCGITSITLSRNSLSSFNEAYLKCSFNNQLDLSYNNLEILEIANDNTLYSNCNLTGNNIQIIKNVYFDTIYFDLLDLSNQASEIRPNWDIKVILKLKMVGNKIPRLSNDSFGLIDTYDSTINVDLSNCSITNITEYYFSEITFVSLNLSFNNISELTNNVFYRSRIETLNMSFSQINSIHNMSFSFAMITVLDLSHNEINYTKNVFNELYTNEIDLSCNKIQFLFSNSFTNVKGLRKLKLSNCLIQIIEVDAFSGLDSLEDLDLSYNRMFILETNNFSNMPILSLNLDGNFITAIMSKAFNNLTRLVEINLFKRGIKSIETKAFHNLPSLQTIDLRNNSISSIPRNLFFQTQHLEEVLLTGNNITDLNLSSNQIKIGSLSLSFNGIMEPRNLSNINIKTLMIQNSQIQVLKANSFDGLYNLNELNFTDSNIYSIESGALNHLYRLKYLDTQNLFKFTKNIPIDSFKDLKSLQIINISSLSLEKLASFSFYGLVNLKTLLLNDNNLKELDNFSFYGLNSLKCLDLSRNKIAIILKNAFSGLDEVIEVRLSDNRLTNFDVHLPTLKVLHLENNSISELSRKTLSLGQLEELYLNHNSLSRIFPGMFQNLTNLKLLNLSYISNLVVSIGGFTNLKKMEKLDLSHNGHYNIRIYDDENVFFSLNSLTHLYLDDNDLTDVNIKALASKLPNLKYVGISQNNWSCNRLGQLIDDFDALFISYQPIISYYYGSNINGISCR